MASNNEHTGARLVSRVPTKDYEKGYDLIFGDKNPVVLKMKEDVKVSVKTQEFLRDIEKDKKKK